ncbi:MAG: PIG-L family deacetylase [Chloroflexaceae bacterium]|nr:PIG-L family deacetylase [Chloroflexaceae bacterium]
MPFHFTRLDQLSAPYRYIYLSPHLDDAALSCGGTIAQHTTAGTPVLVVNVCTGAPPAGAPLSHFASLMHHRWNLSAEEAMARRLREDAEALEILRADGLHLDLLDAIYRMPEAYTSDDTLFGPVAEGDRLAADVQARLEALIARFPDAVIYAPLGVGRHVDHLATFAAALGLSRNGASVAFYEDFPYVCGEQALTRRLAELGGPDRFLPLVTSIDATLTRKIGAIEAYTSQLDVLFGGAAAMARTVRDYAARVSPDAGAYGERIWMFR